MRSASGSSGSTSPLHNRRQQQSSAYAGTSSAAPTTAQQYAPSSAVTQGEVFRSLVFDGSVALCVSLVPEELPAGSDRSMDVYYMQAPRIAYLPMLLGELRTNLLDLVLDDHGRATLAEDQLWLECQGEPLKWHWPIGLIHDHIKANTILANIPARHPTSFLSKAPASSGTQPLQVRLHLASPPTDKLLLSPSLEACKANFMNQLKEADYVRWGSVKRMTSLRRADQDALWESLISHDFDRYWAVAAKLVPAPPASRPSSGNPSRATSPVLSTASTFDATGRLPDARTQRSIPMRIYLPHGGPVIQDVLPATIAQTGQPQTLQSALESLLPRLFPPRPGGNADMSASFISHRKQLVSRVILQGIEMPLDAELAWCSTCLAYPDGWLGVVLGL